MHSGSVVGTEEVSPSQTSVGWASGDQSPSVWKKRALKYQPDLTMPKMFDTKQSFELLSQRSGATGNGYSRFNSKNKFKTPKASEPITPAVMEHIGEEYDEEQEGEEDQDEGNYDGPQVEDLDAGTPNEGTSSQMNAVTADVRKNNLRQQAAQEQKEETEQLEMCGEEFIEAVNLMLNQYN